MPTVEQMLTVCNRVCNYRCGECGYYETAAWSAHNKHYNAHLRKTT